MIKKELAYYINELTENFIYESEEVAVKMNSKILLSFLKLDIITEDVYSKCSKFIGTNTASDIKKATDILEETLEVLPEKVEIEVDVLLEDFNKTYDVIAYDSALTSAEKLDKLKAYYFTFVRDVAKEIKFLTNLQKKIQQQEQEEEGIDVLLIDFEDYVKQFYN